MDRASAAEIPKAARSRPSWSSLANDPYVAAAPAPRLGLAHRAAGTRVFATSASRASSLDAARERARPGAERRHATTATERRVVVDARGVVPCPDVARVARSSRAISSERKLAIDSSVGWSNNAVGARSALNHAASVLTNSVVAIESRPADMSGAFISTTVPMTSRATARTSSRASIRRHVARP